MSDVGDRLRSADPVDGEPPPSAEDLRRMRHAVTAAARDARPARAWGRPAWIAAVTAVVMVAGVSVDQLRRAQGRGASVASPRDAPGASAMSTGLARQRRQLQFVTPGGTRVIWVFDSEFEIPGGDRP